MREILLFFDSICLSAFKTVSVTSIELNSRWVNEEICFVLFVRSVTRSFNTRHVLFSIDFVRSNDDCLQRPLLSTFSIRKWEKPSHGHRVTLLIFIFIEFLRHVQRVDNFRFSDRSRRRDYRNFRFNLFDFLSFFPFEFIVKRKWNEKRGKIEQNRWKREKISDEQNTFVENVKNRNEIEICSSVALRIASRSFSFDHRSRF